MKTVKRLFCILLTVCILVCAIPLSASAEEETRFGKSILGKMNNSAALIYVYEKLVDGIKNSTTEISLAHQTYKLNWDEASTVYRLVYYDYPEYFWINGGCDGSINSNTKVVLSISPSYAMSGSALNAAKDKFNQKVNSLLVGLDGKSEYEKSLLLHDRIIKQVSYITTNNDQNAYGALVEGKAVCAGYSRAYQLLMNKAGLSAWYVSGTGQDPDKSQPESHAWNLVLVDDNWYYTDVTWDDQGDDSNIFYAYFNVTSKQINEDHTADEFVDYLPNATATAANYFVKNNRVFNSEIDIERLANLLNADQNNTAHIYTTGNANLFKLNLKNNMSNIVKKMGVPANMRYSYSISSLGKEFEISIKITEAHHTHNPQLVPAKAATCTSLGNKQYYSCFCGSWFTDAEGLNEITDKNTVNIKTVAHTPSNYKYNESNHWKVCTVCKAEIAASNTAHADKDRDGECDDCFTKVKPIVSNPVSSTSSGEEVSSNNDSVADANSANNNATLDFSVLGKFLMPFIYIGIGVVGSLVVTAIILIIVKKKK